MINKKKTNCQLSSNLKQISISKLIKIQNMTNEVILDYITSLENDLPFSSNDVNIKYINDVYSYVLLLYSLHVVERAKKLKIGGK